MIIKASYLSYEDIWRRADQFLKEHHAEGTIPVPIERIVEFRLEMDIVPIPGLRDLIDMEGFVTSDLREIYVEELVYNKWPNRYRFTLAHEVGHVVLHESIFREAQFSSIEGWKQFINSISEKEHSWLEYQAYAFAGLVLVPREPLISEAQQCVQMVESEGIKLREDSDFAWSRIAAFLAKRFEVSTEVIEKRIAKDKIPEEFST